MIIIIDELELNRFKFKPMRMGIKSDIDCLEKAASLIEKKTSKNVQELQNSLDFPSGCLS